MTDLTGGTWEDNPDLSEAECWRRRALTAEEAFRQIDVLDLSQALWVRGIIIIPTNGAEPMCKTLEHECEAESVGGVTVIIEFPGSDNPCFLGINACSALFEAIGLQEDDSSHSEILRGILTCATEIVCKSKGKWHAVQMLANLSDTLKFEADVNEETGCEPPLGGSCNG